MYCGSIEELNVFREVFKGELICCLAFALNYSSKKT